MATRKVNKKTKKAYEQYLNEYYSEMSVEHAQEELGYITSNLRYGSILTMDKLIQRIEDGKAGAVIREYDPIRFEVGFNEWKN